MIIVNDSECRNLQQQVAKNANDIADLKKYSDLYTTHCVKLSGSSVDSITHTSTTWTLTAFHKMPVNDVKGWGEWIQEALVKNHYSIDSMIYCEQGNLVPLVQFYYNTDKDAHAQINCRGIAIKDEVERTFSIDIGDFDQDHEFEI